MTTVQYDFAEQAAAFRAPLSAECGEHGGAGLKFVEQGPPGNAGPPGDGSVSLQAHEVVALADGAQVITLDGTPGVGSVQLFINGLRQAIDAFSVTGDQVSLPSDLNVIAGDDIAITYFI